MKAAIITGLNSKGQGAMACSQAEEGWDLACVFKSSLLLPCTEGISGEKKQRDCLEGHYSDLSKR